MYDHLSELTCGKCKESYWIPEDLLPARITKGNNKEIIGNVLILRPRQWDDSYLVFRRDKKPITDGLGATWSEVKSRMPWVKNHSEICNKCVMQLIEDKDVEFRNMDTPKYPVYCDMCNRFLNIFAPFRQILHYPIIDVIL